MTSKHYTNDRQRREAMIQQIGEGRIITEKVFDKGHPNGPEIHKLTDTGIILIYNQRTGKLITKLIARPGHVKRFYNGDAPKELIRIAYEHTTKGYNYL